MFPSLAIISFSSVVTAAPAEKHWKTPLFVQKEIFCVAANSYQRIYCSLTKVWLYWTPFTPVNRLRSLQLNEIGKKGKLGKKQKMTCKLKAKGNAKTFPLSPADQKFLTGLKLVRILRPRYADLPRNSIFELVQKNSFQTWSLCSTPQNKITDSLWIQWKVVETKPA